MTSFLSESEFFLRHNMLPKAQTRFYHPCLPYGIHYFGTLLPKMTSRVSII